MKTIDEWFAEYSKDHQHSTNQKIHYVCVPAILYAVLGILWVLPNFQVAGVDIHWNYLLIAGACVFYFLLDFKMGLFMLLLTALISRSFLTLDQMGIPVFEFNLAIFIIAWIGQFYGHKLEGAKPSFLTDLTYLFIGPLWVVKKLLHGKKAS